MSGDLHSIESLVADQFIDKLQRFRCGDGLLKVVDTKRMDDSKIGNVRKLADSGADVRHTSSPFPLAITPTCP
ncbi:MAG: hypothetical protein ACI9DC_004259 [Gammaproteobacteria bacterium]|jgi:hypothetical protein